MTSSTAVTRRDELANLNQVLAYYPASCINAVGCEHADLQVDNLVTAGHDSPFLPGMTWNVRAIHLCPMQILIHDIKAGKVFFTFLAFKKSTPDYCGTGNCITAVTSLAAFAVSSGDFNAKLFFKDLHEYLLDLLPKVLTNLVVTYISGEDPDLLACHLAQYVALPIFHRMHTLYSNPAPDLLAHYNAQKYNGRFYELLYGGSIRKTSSSEWITLKGQFSFKPIYLHDAQNSGGYWPQFSMMEHVRSWQGRVTPEALPDTKNAKVDEDSMPATPQTPSPSQTPTAHADPTPPPLQASRLPRAQEITFPSHDVTTVQADLAPLIQPPQEKQSISEKAYAWLMSLVEDLYSFFEKLWKCMFYTETTR